jgi:hypothetical protein
MSTTFQAKERFTRMNPTYSIPTADCTKAGLPPMMIGIRRLLWVCHWIGIDGYTSADVLQCGTETKVTCPSAATHWFWIEWYPKISTVVELGVNTNDRVSLFLTVMSPTSGLCILSNLTTRQSSSFSIGAPPGTQLVGNCIEWIVERPEEGGFVSPLPNYGGLKMSKCVANAKQGYWPGRSPTGTIWNVTMVENGTACSIAKVPGGNPPDEIDFSFVPR